MRNRGETRQIRAFAFVGGGILCVVGLWPLLARGASPRMWALALCGVLVVPGIFFPGILKPLFRVWMFLGRILAWINTRLLMGLIFYGMFTPIGIIRRWMGKDSMRRQLRVDTESYETRSRQRDATHMTRQY